MRQAATLRRASPNPDPGHSELLNHHALVYREGCFWRQFTAGFFVCRGGLSLLEESKRQRRQG